MTVQSANDTLQQRYAGIGFCRLVIDSLALNGQHMKHSCVCLCLSVVCIGSVYVTVNNFMKNNCIIDGMPVLGP